MLVFSLTSAGQAQTDFNYKANLGDTITYRIDSYNVTKSNFQPSISLLSWVDSSSQVRLANGTLSSVSFKTGDVFTINVCSLFHVAGQPAVTIQVTIQGLKTICKPTSAIGKIANNTQYYQDLVITNSSEFKLNGDELTSISKITNQNNNTVTYVNVLNIKSGFYVENYMNETTLEGSLVSEIKIIQIPSGFDGTQFNILLFLVDVALAIVLLVIKYKKSQN